MIAILALATVVIIAGGIFYWQRSSAPAGEPQVPQTIAAEPDNRVRRFSDGMLIEPEEQPKRWYAVMIENSAEAWPLSGLSQARLVFEAPVEGSIPRFMALYDDSQDVQKIGPVRSARPYYIDWALGLEAMYVHVGGSPDALSKINQLVVASLNQFYWDPFFWRSSDRYAPHNVYTSTKLLAEGFVKRGYEDSDELPALGWDYIDETTESNPNAVITPATEIRVPFSNLTRDYDAVWKYDGQANRYARWQDTEQQTDQDGTPVYANNVMVLNMSVSVIDDVGRREIDTISSGKGLLFRDGQRFEIIWKKAGRGEPLQLLDADGNKVKLQAGPTWIEIIPLSTEV